MKLTITGLVAIAVLALNGTSMAIDMTFDNIQGQGVHFDYSGTRGSAISGNTTAGRFNWTVTSCETINGVTFNAGDQFTTFCTELTQFISTGDTFTYSSVAVADMPTVGQLGAPMGSFRAGLIQELFNNYYATAVNGTTTEAAAFQVAVWEIVYEDRVDDVGSSLTIAAALNAGADSFTVSSNYDAVQQANTWLDALTGNYSADDSLIGFGSGSAQDQLLLVPLPAPLWLAGVGLAGVVFGRRKLQRLALN